MEFIRKIGFLEFALLIGFFINPFSFGFVFGYLLLIYFLLRLKDLKGLFDSDVMVLLLFASTYSLFYAFNPVAGTQVIFIYLIFPPVFYLFGKLLARKLADQYLIKKMLLSIAIIYSLVGLVSVLLNIVQEGFVRFERDVPLIWGNTINATGTAAMLFANMCIPALLIFGFKKNKVFNFIALLILFLLSVASALRLGSRTQIGIFVFTLLASLVFLFSKQNIVKKVFTFFVLFIGVNVIVSYFNVDYDSDILSSYATRMESKKYGASTAGGRTEKWAKSFENLFEKPLGWELEEFGYSHNLWFDAARSGTVFALIFLVGFNLLGTKRIIRLLSDTSLDLRLKNQCMVYFLAFMLQFLVEPILDGSFELFVFFCFFSGLVKAIPNLQAVSEQNS